MEEQTSLKALAMNYEAPSTKNIAELEIVRTDWNIKTKTAKDNDGVEFEYHVIEHNHNDYRVPRSVLGALRDILITRPDLKTFKVIKSGQGMQTRYTVVPIE